MAEGPLARADIHRDSNEAAPPGAASDVKAQLDLLLDWRPRRHASLPARL